ncbi:hypothetical protein ACMXYV_09075 [Neptuniibacter sp. SY11_33]|uniref:hypothetical protein n=1 Tax=Neptuniibacter sp. SY11_33 TaxID=3398215 RepID=UPI0039F4EF31
MHQETELLVKAIDGLRQDPNYFKDYIFPIASAFFTSILGAAIAYFTLKHQEKIQIEKEKMDTANKWTLLMEEARAALISIKGNYYKDLSDHPLKRVATIPSILFHASPVEESFEKLSFIIPKAEDRKKDYPKWSQISRIRSMVNNYNYLLQLWQQRNQIERPIKEQLMAKFPHQSYVDISYEEAVAAIGPANMSVLVDLTERVIKLTDDIIIELDNFLCEFPKYAKTRIDTKRLKQYGSVLIYSNNGNELLIEILKRTPAPNLKEVEALFGEPADEIEKRLVTGYE